MMCLRFHSSPLYWKVEAGKSRQGSRLCSHSLILYGGKFCNFTGPSFLDEIYGP